MKTLVKINRTIPYFERTIDEIISTGFFNSFDSNTIETDEAYSLEVGVPGMTKKDLTLDIEDGVLKISGHKQQKCSSWLNKMSEFNAQSLNRTFLIPEDVQIEKISAECKNGLLKVFMPKEYSSSFSKTIKIEEAKSIDSMNLFTRIKDVAKKMKYKLLRKKVK